jgi:hypothetical protein
MDPNTQNTPQMAQSETGVGMPEMTQGGPTGGTPYFMGDQSLVRFSGQGPAGAMNANTLWLLDKKTKTARPFQDMQAVQNYFGQPVDINQAQVIPSTELSPGGLFGAQEGRPGFELLDGEYAIKSDGTTRDLEFSSAQLADHYGHQQDPVAEQNASMVLDGFMNTLARAQNSGIQPASLEQMKTNPRLLAFYINALAYGGYTLGDIYRDMKYRELGLKT